MATQLGVLGEDVKLYMKLLTSNIYYALNDRTINLLMKGDIDMSAVVGGEAIGNTISDAELVDIIVEEREVELFVVGKNKTRAGGSFFPCVNDTIFDLTKYGIFENLVEGIISITAYTLLCKQVDYQILNYKNSYYHYGIVIFINVIYLKCVMR